MPENGEIQASEKQLMGSLLQKGKGGSEFSHPPVNYSISDPALIYRNPVTGEKEADSNIGYKELMNAWNGGVGLIDTLYPFVQTIGGFYEGLKDEEPAHEYGGPTDGEKGGGGSVSEEFVENLVTAQYRDRAQERQKDIYAMMGLGMNSTKDDKESDEIDLKDEKLPGDYENLDDLVKDITIYKNSREIGN